MNEMNGRVNGATIAGCFRLASDCGREINAMDEALKNLFLKASVNHADSLPWKILEGDKASKCKDVSGWVQTDFSRSFPLARKGKKRPQMYLGYQISLSGDAIAISEPEPLVHVYCWENPVDFSDWYMGYPLDGTSQPELVDNVVFWPCEATDNGRSSCWTFSIRLSVLNNPEDLDRNIIQPAVKLLKGEGAESSLLGVTGLLIYPDDFPKKSTDQA